MIATVAMTLGMALANGAVAHAADGQDDFGIETQWDGYVIHTGSPLTFKVRTNDMGASTWSVGDLSSLVYNGVEYQDRTRGSQLNSGFDYIYNGATPTVSAEQVDDDHIKVTVTVGQLRHYYFAVRGESKIYMATTFTKVADYLGMIRYIVRIPHSLLPNGPAASDLSGNTGAIESGDVFGMADGTTRSKHYSNMRPVDWSHIGATGDGVGVWMVRGDQAGSSGGPFYRSLLNQGAGDQEITYIVQYGESKTEPFRTDIMNDYTLVFNDGSEPGDVDTSWLERYGVAGDTGRAARGSLRGTVSGMDAGTDYTVGLANSAAQFWGKVRAGGSGAGDAAGHTSGTGTFDLKSVIPGTYVMTVYRNELEVERRSVTIKAGSANDVGAIAIGADPTAEPATWRIGEWDGSPKEFRHGDKVTTMHPSDSRITDAGGWTQATPYAVGQSTASDWPAYQFKSVNGVLSLTFNLTADQVRDSVLRIGITDAQAGARPSPSINGWAPRAPGISLQPTSRMLTVGSYRGNNTTYTFYLQARRLVVGENTIAIGVYSGSSGGWIGPALSYDAIDLVPYQWRTTPGISGTVTIPDGTYGDRDNKVYVAAYKVGAGAGTSAGDAGAADANAANAGTDGVAAPIAEVVNGAYTVSGLEDGATYALRVSDRNGSIVNGFLAEDGSIVNDIADAKLVTAGSTDVAIAPAATAVIRGSVAFPEGAAYDHATWYTVDALDTAGRTVATGVADAAGGFVLRVPAGTSPVVRFADASGALASGYAGEDGAIVADSGKAVAVAAPTDALVLRPSVADRTAPVFAGVADVSVDFGGAFDAMAGVSASDDRDGDVTGSVKVAVSFGGKAVDAVDTRKAGVYTLTYTVSDKAGNTATVKRVVTVRAKVPEPAPECVPARFTDLAGASHVGDIEWLSCQKITEGFPNGDGTVSFGGMRTVVRQDMAAFLWRMAGEPEFDVDKELADGSPFTDVTRDTPHVEAILWLAKAGISTGYANGDGTRSFGGMRTVVRQDMAAFLHRYARWRGVAEPSGQAVAFTDVDGHTSHREDIDWLSRTGVTTGYDNGDGTRSFGGMRDVVRQDMAAFLHRMSANVLK